MAGGKEIKVEKLFKDNMKVIRGKDKLWHGEGQGNTRRKLEGYRLKRDKDKRANNLTLSIHVVMIFFRLSTNWINALIF